MEVVSERLLNKTGEQYNKVRHEPLTVHKPELIEKPAPLFSRLFTTVKASCYKMMHWETWHYLAKYIPLYPFWMWYCVRARSCWFFTPSNPTLTFGGFEGESKKEMYDQLPPGTFPNTIYIDPSLPFNEAEAMMKRHNMQYPFAVKPDVGMMGFLFRKINNREEFQRYHRIMPCVYILQDLIKYPLEVSVFYYRMPDEQKGTITGFIKKEYLQVIGDGKSTLLELMHDYPRVRFRLEEMKQKHKEKLNEVVPDGEIYCLSQALNLSRGGKLVSLEKEKDEKLLALFDNISHYTKHFYYGRYDIKCSSIEDLKEGKNFSILEFNGSGAEPHHVYGNGNTLLQAYKILLHHWKMLYRISRRNYHRGISYWSFKKGWKFLREAKRHFKHLKKLDAEFPAL